MDRRWAYLHAVAVCTALSACTQGSAETAASSDALAATGCDGIGRIVYPGRMVPGNPTSVTICSEASAALPVRPRQTKHTLSSGFDHLIDVLNAGRVGRSYCDGGGLARTYTLEFHYVSGPDVAIDVTPDCHPSITNGAAKADNVHDVVTEVDNLIGLR